jgi:hypothetical protein
MALKDLAVTSAKLTEAQIEELIAPYVRYNVGEGTIIFRPAAGKLTNKQRLLGYLVALQGWPHLGEDQRATTATPAELGRGLNLEGGSLRPILKQLKDSHLVTATGRAYSVANASVEDLRAELSLSSGAAGGPAKVKPPKRAKVAKAAAARPAAVAPHHAKGKRRGGEGGVFRKWIQDGFFNKPRTFKEVLDRFHSQGRILKQTSLPGYLLEATRAEILERVKKEVAGKRVYVYFVGPKGR